MDQKQYSRDKRSPKPKNAVVSQVMSANKARNTNPELIFRRYLWSKGIKGYRLNYDKLPGKPDIVFASKKLAIFIHGCFWHRCPTCNYSLPRNNRDFWESKFEKNIARDQKKIDQLKKMGWDVIVFWECEIKTNLDSLAKTVESILYKSIK